MTTFYLGQFPPPYGGVTVKNALLRDELSKHLPIDSISFHKDGIFKVLRTVLFSNKDDVFILGFGNNDLRRRFVKFLAKARPKVLKHTIIIGMGGRLGKELLEDKSYAKSCAKSLAVCLETNGMIREAEKAGLRNAILLPNCRPRPIKKYELRNEEPNRPLRAIFFSKIGKEKGADLVLELSRLTPSIEYSFYGTIDNDFEDSFYRAVEDLPNIEYHGVVNSATEEMVNELKQYDIHIFPTRWKYEGVPGVLVETKLAGVPSIVSDICYNSEIVDDGISGIVMTDFDVEKWVETIHSIDSDRDILRKLKQGTVASAFDYYIDSCIEPIVNLVKKVN